MSNDRNVSQLLEEIKTNREEIATDSYTATWREVINLYKEGDIVISPEYQRLFRWDLERQTQFIESLLLNIPVPTLFFYIDQEGRQEVIDGLQRISTVIRFFAHEIFNKEQLINGEQDGSENNLTNPTILDISPMLPSLQGWTAKDLPEKVIRTIKNSRVNVVILEQETKPQTKYNVFRRLNKSGVKLSDQEIRNCTSRLVGNEFANKIRVIASDNEVISALGLSEDKQKTQACEEALLRTLASLFYHDNFVHHVDDFLDDYMYYASENNTLNAEIETNLRRTFSLISSATDNGKAFKFRNTVGQPKGSFSTNLLDIVATGVYKNINNLSAADLLSKLDILWEEKREKINECTGSGSNTPKKLKLRLALGEEVFGNG